MISELVELAHALDLPCDGFAHREASWLIRLHADGRPASPRPLWVKATPGAETRRPDCYRSGSGAVPLPGGDTAEYLLPVFGGLGKAARAAARHAAMTAMIGRFAAAYPTGPGPALHRFLTGQWQALDLPPVAAAQPGKAVGEALALGDFIRFELAGKPLEAHPDVAAFWRDLREETTTVEHRGQCLACGQTPGRLLTKLKVTVRGIPGSKAAGVTLTPLNNPSAGDTDNLANTIPLCEPCGTAAATALQHLLDTGRNTKRIGSSLLVWWSTAPQTLTYAEVLLTIGVDGGAAAQAALHNLAEERAHHRVGRLSAGLPALRPDEGRLHVARLGISGGARLVVEAFDQWSLAALAETVQSWLDDTLAAERLLGVDETRPVAPWMLASAACPPRQRASKRVEQTLIEALFERRPVPHTVAAATVRRAAIEDGARLDADGRRRHRPRLALLSLYLTRTKGTSMPDPENQSVAFRCGRVLALAETAQYYALGSSPDNTIAVRRLRRAMTSPASTFGPLLAEVETYLSTAGGRRCAGWVRPLIEDLLADTGGRLPSRLTVPEQTELTLGLHYQRSQRRRRTGAADHQEDDQ